MDNTNTHKTQKLRQTPTVQAMRQKQNFDPKGLLKGLHHGVFNYPFYHGLTLGLPGSCSHSQGIGG